MLFFTRKESRPRASQSLTQLHHGARGLFRRGQRYTRRPHRRWGTQGSNTHRRDERARVAGARGQFYALLLPASRPRPFAARPVLTLLSADIRSRSSSLTQVSGRFVASKLAPGGARLKPACEIARASRFPRFPRAPSFQFFFSTTRTTTRSLSHHPAPALSHQVAARCRARPKMAGKGPPPSSPPRPRTRTRSSPRRRTNSARCCPPTPPRRAPPR